MELTSSQALRSWRTLEAVELYPEDTADHIVYLEDCLDKALDKLKENNIQHGIPRAQKLQDDPC